MRCEKCGSEMPENTKFCTECGAPMQTGAGGPAGPSGEPSKAASPEPSGAAETSGSAPAEPGTAAASAPVAASQTGDPAAQSAKASGSGRKKLVAAAIIVLVAVVGIFAASGMFRKKDPKETVIAAFKSLTGEGETLPSKELFGLEALMESAGKTDTESGLTLKLKACSDSAVGAYAGSGLRIAGRNDVKNKKTDANIGVLYGGMDLLNLDIYYGDELMMMQIPELSGRVFKLDLGPGLESRLAESPTVGPLLAQYGIGAEELAAYANLLKEQTERSMSAESTPFDVEALWNRYREGSQAQENFKAAMTVEKADKASCTVDGKPEDCQGYRVLISKDAMIAFLRSSADFFLQDETLREDFLNQLRMTTEMAGLFTVTYNGPVPTAEEMLEDGYDEAKKSVDQMIGYLDQALNDVEMTVYVDKKDRMAVLEGTTSFNLEPDGGTEGDSRIQADFKAAFEGGAYITQNMNAEMTLTDGKDPLTFTLLRQGTYDKKRLTCDVSLDVKADSSTLFAAYTGTYDSDGNAYHIGLEAGADGEKLFSLSSDGLLEVKKGSSMEITIDTLSGEIEGDFVTLDGDFYYRPLSRTIEPPEGEEFDVLAATEANWKMLMMEVGMKALGLMNKLGISGV